MSNFIETRPEGAAPIDATTRTDRRTDMTKVISYFRDYTKAFNNLDAHAPDSIEY